MAGGNYANFFRAKSPVLERVFEIWKGERGLTGKNRGGKTKEEMRRNGKGEWVGQSLAGRPLIKRRMAVKMTAPMTEMMMLTMRPCSPGPP